MIYKAFATFLITSLPFAMGCFIDTDDEKSDDDDCVTACTTDRQECVTECDNDGDCIKTCEDDEKECASACI